MPSASLSPHLAAMTTAPSSPRAHPAPGPPTAPTRPPLMKRHTTQSSQRLQSQQHHHPATSPGSVTNDHQQLRHHVKSRHSHAKIVLPRNHSSARNLGKLVQHKQTPSQQFSQTDDGRRHARQRSHEGDTEIRLPGSLDESRPPPMRRNLTAAQLPRNPSHAKLKKNHSHGHLGKLNSSRNLAALSSTTHKAPPSPGLKGRGKRRKSEEVVDEELDLHEQEVELARQQQLRREGPKRVGFAVGSPEDTSGGDDVPEMEGSGLQEDEWTEESASASPFSTRQNTAQNTADNSRRTSVAQDHRVPDTHAVGSALAALRSPLRNEGWRGENRRSDLGQEGVQDSPDLPMTATALSSQSPPPQSNEVNDAIPSIEEPPLPQPPAQKSPLHPAKDHPNPATRHLLARSQQLPAPALLSNVSAMDDVHSTRGASPAPSISSSAHNHVVDDDASGDTEQEELVSRFVASGTHHSTSRNNSHVGTAAPHLPSDRDSAQFSPTYTTHPTHHPSAPLNNYQLGPASPGSTVSGSSGATTPALGRSRTELRLLQEKVLADMESAAERQPVLPAHVYDRRNESLKSYLNLAGPHPPPHHGSGDSNSGIMGASASASGSFSPSEIGHFTGIPHAPHAYGPAAPMGPEMFQGRFRAVNMELRVVQKFRDPIAEAVARLKACKTSAIRPLARKERESSANAQHARSISGPAAASATGVAGSASVSTSPHKTHASLAPSSLSPPLRTPATTASTSASASGSPVPRHNGPLPPHSNLTSPLGTLSRNDSTGLAPNANPAGVASASSSHPTDPRQRQRREVSFARTPPQTLEFERSKEELALLGPEVVARMLWESI